jgi:N-acetylmuramoyl-L-alanine amidase
VVFKIQLAALSGEFKDRAKMAQLLKEVTTETLPNGLTRYYGGKATTYAQAQKLLETAKANGYTTAFIVGFVNGQRMNSEQMKVHMQ